MASSEFITTVEAVEDKDGFMIRAVNERLNTEELVAVQDKLKTEIEKLKTAASHLKTTLLEKSRLIEKFLDECNDLYVGTGPNDEYLLDICAQASTACLERATSSHATCCCAYHPFTAYGEVTGLQNNIAVVFCFRVCYILLGSGQGKEKPNSPLLATMSLCVTVLTLESSVVFISHGGSRITTEKAKWFNEV